MTTTERPTGTPTPEAGLEPGRPPENNPEHFFIEPGEPWPDDVPKDQDLGWWRFRDNPKGAARAERKILACWAAAALASIGLIATYLAGGQTQAEGALLFFAMSGIATGLIIWARDLLPGHEVTAKRNHQGGSGLLERASAVTSLARGTEPMARRPVLLRMLGAVGGLFVLALAFPIASLGPRPHRSLYKSGWGQGTRLVDQDGRTLKPGDIAANAILTVFPSAHVNNAETEKDPQSATVLINVGRAKFDVRPGTEGWEIPVADGTIVAFSKICTHAGCPVGLYNSDTRQLVCPCHQSTFDVLGGCNPVFGPASRSLPQLPLAVDGEGFLISQSDYREPVGPGFWNRK